MEATTRRVPVEREDALVKAYLDGKIDLAAVVLDGLNYDEPAMEDAQP